MGQPSGQWRGGGTSANLLKLSLEETRTSMGPFLLLFLVSKILRFEEKKLIEVKKSYLIGPREKIKDRPS
jgi:hypothetical protein